MYFELYIIRIEFTAGNLRLCFISRLQNIRLMAFSNNLTLQISTSYSS